jgi:transcriptional regulator with PAS, ATPase and Fis domain
VDEWVDEQKERFAREASCQCQGKFALVSDAIRRCHEQIVRAAERGTRNVLLRGPTGSGKTVCAHCFRHNHRDEFRRAEERFRAINCGAIAPNLMESELFGHVRGAFSGALTDRKGVIRSADRGIVFLDEVGELSPAAQVALLKVIEEKKVRPVGSDRDVDVDVVFIAASHLDFEKAIREGRFREDLYFRLAQVVVQMPPLADRLSDVAGIISLEEGGPRLLARLDDDAKAFLLGEGQGKGATYAWRGNAREVKEFVANMDDHIVREGPITLAQCRAVLTPSEGAPAAPQSPPPSQPPAAASAPFDWLEIYDRAVARSITDAKNKVDNYALWSKAVLIGQLVAKRRGASSPSAMPDPKNARDDKDTRTLFIKLAGELEVSAWTTVADHYDAFFALLEGKPHPRRDKAGDGNRDSRTT